MPDINELVQKGKTSLQEVNQLTPTEQFWVEQLAPLILQDDITVQNIKEFNHEDIHRCLHLFNYMDLILAKVIKVDQVNTLTSNDRERINTCKELILSGRITIQEVQGLTDDEYEQVDTLRALILSGRMAINEVRKLTVYECIKINICKELILKNLMTIKEAQGLTNHEYTRINTCKELADSNTKCNFPSLT